MIILAVFIFTIAVIIYWFKPIKKIVLQDKSILDILEKCDGDFTLFKIIDSFDNKISYRLCFEKKNKKKKEFLKKYFDGGSIAEVLEKFEKYDNRH
jgi:hypothetical protein